MFNIITKLILLFILFVSCSCSNNKQHLIICPYDYMDKYKKNSDRFQLASAKYLAIIVKKNNCDFYPVKHYRAKTSTSWNLKYRTKPITWDKPRIIGNYFIFNKTEDKLYVAIRRNKNSEYRIFPFHLKAIKNDVLFLPPFESLEIVNDENKGKLKRYLL